MKSEETTALLIRSAIYTATVLYLIVDLYLLHGPLRQQVDRIYTPPAASNAPYAQPAGRIFGRIITLGDLDTRVVRDKLRQGTAIDLEKLDQSTLVALRTISLDKIFADLGIDAKLTARPELRDAQDGDALIQAAEKRFGGSERLNDILARAHLTRAAYTSHLRREAARYAWLRGLLDKAAPTDKDIDAWFEEHKDSLRRPERLQLDHLFLATLHKSSDEVKHRIDGFYAQIQDGSASFEDLVKAHSDDPATRARGGALGWIEGKPVHLPRGFPLEALLAAPATRARNGALGWVEDRPVRLPRDFPLEALLAAPADGSVLPPLRSALGWHLFRVRARAPETLATLEEMRPSIRALLQSEREEVALRGIINQIRKEGDALLFKNTLRLPPTIPRK